MTYCNAGHNPPYLIDADGTVRPFESSSNKVLGIFPNEVFKVSEKTLEPNETLFLYTDGVTEYCNATRCYYGTERLETHLATLANKPPQVIIESVLSDLKKFGSDVQMDDVTLLVFKPR